MTQLDLAEKLHYSDKAVSKWERGESVPEIGTLTAIADLFGVPLDYLVRSEHEEPAAAVEQQPAAPVPDHKKKNRALIAGMSVLLVWFGTGSAMILYAGSAVYGFFFASCVVLVPILVRQLFGQREYPQIYSRVSMFVNIVGAVGAPFWAFFGDMSYSILFTVAIVLMVVVLLLGIFCFGKMKGLQADWTE